MSYEERPNGTRSRQEDLRPLTRWERLRRWWEKWRQLIYGISGMIGMVVSFGAAGFVCDFNRQRAEDQRVVRVLAEEQSKNSKERAETARATAAAAKLTCLRTRRFAPYLLKDYEIRKVLPPALIADYKRTLPKSCPK